MTKAEAMAALAALPDDTIVESMTLRSPSAHASVRSRYIPARTRRGVLERYGMRCGLCKLPIEPHETLHIDHIVPFSLGGESTPENLQPAHGSCNISKGNRVP